MNKTVSLSYKSTPIYLTPLRNKHTILPRYLEVRYPSDTDFNSSIVEEEHTRKEVYFCNYENLMVLS
jgi:hypothetical protein